MKRLGLIGGIGTLAGVSLVWRMVDQCAKDGARKDSEFPQFVYLNVPTTDTTATGCIPNDSQRQIMRAFDELERLKCDVALILCNTAHFLFDEFCKRFSGDIVNMVETAAGMATGRVAVLQSRMASDHWLYEKPLRERNCAIAQLSESQQQTVDDLIADCIGYRNMDESPIILQDLLSDLSDANCTQVIIGCTELSMIPVWFDQKYMKVVDAGFEAIKEAIRICA